MTLDTANMKVEDPLIQLAKANSGSDALDIGMVGLYDTSGSQDLYGGLFRDANDAGKWKFFKDSQEDLSTATVVNTGATGYAAADVVMGGLEAAATSVSTLGTSGLATLASATVTATATLNGHVILGSDAADDITPNGKFASALVPKTNAIDCGTPSDPFREFNGLKATIDDVQIDAKSISALDVGANSDLTISGKGTGSVVMAKVDINGGAIDGAAIGAAAASSGVFTSLDCDNKALRADVLNINSGTGGAITLAAADEFAVSDADAANAIKKTTMADIQAYLAASASDKIVSVMTGTVAAGALVNNQQGFPNMASTLLAQVRGASHSASKSEIYLNGMLLSRGADGDYAGAETLTEDFAYDTDAAAGSPAPGLIFNMDLVAGDHIAIMVRS